jgi:hypothetical protein
MQDDQISQKFIGVTPADMDRLPNLINTKFFFSSKQPSLSAGITPKSSLPCLQGLIVCFYECILLLVKLLRFLWFWAFLCTYIVTTLCSFFTEETCQSANEIEYAEPINIFLALDPIP